MNVVPVENQSDVADVAEPGKDKDKQKPRRNLADV
jgi:hypothetical protein